MNRAYPAEAWIATPEYDKIMGKAWGEYASMFSIRVHKKFSIIHTEFLPGTQLGRQLGRYHETVEAINTLL